MVISLATGACYTRDAAAAEAGSSSSSLTSSSAPPLPLAGRAPPGVGGATAECGTSANSSGWKPALCAAAAEAGDGPQHGSKLRKSLHDIPLRQSHGIRELHRHNTPHHTTPQSERPNSSNRERDQQKAECHCDYYPAVMIIDCLQMGHVSERSSNLQTNKQTKGCAER